jgi:hypothetical protein
MAAIDVASREVVWARDHGGVEGGSDTGNLCDATEASFLNPSGRWTQNISEVAEELDEMATVTRSRLLLDVIISRGSTAATGLFDVMYRYKNYEYDWALLCIP